MPHETLTNGDGAVVLAVLEWARDNGIALASVASGTVRVELFEQRAAADRKREDRPRGGAGIYAELGGEVWKHAVRAGDIEGAGHGASEGEDLEPVVGSGA